jgi:hypothetical protein
MQCTFNLTADPLEVPSGSKEGEVVMHCSGVPAGMHAQITVKGKGTGLAWQSVKISSGEAKAPPTPLCRRPRWRWWRSHSFENLPPRVTAENLVAAGGDSSLKIRLKATAETPAGRYTRVAILGNAEKGGQIQEAPKVGITIN